MDELRKTEALVFLCPDPTITRWGEVQMRLTREFMLSARSPAGGWNHKQLKVLGIKWPPRKGWLHRLEGKEITLEQAQKLLALRDYTFMKWFEDDLKL